MQDTQDVKMRIDTAGANSVIVYFSGSSTLALNRSVMSFYHALTARQYPWFESAVPSYDSVLVTYDWLQVDHLLVRQLLLQLSISDVDDNSSCHHVMKVWYGAKGANDLELIAQQTQLSEAEIIDIHCGQTYRVFTVGFMPGFAYLGETPKRLAVPRMASPRLKVPKGAVAIADRQTAIYPDVSPGGWHLMGLCPTKLIDDKSRLSLLTAGDTVAFVPISEEEYREESRAHVE